MKTKLLLAIMYLFVQASFGQITVCVDTLTPTNPYKWCADSVQLVTNACPASNQWTIFATSQIIHNTASVKLTKATQGTWQFKCTGNTAKTLILYLDSLPYKASDMHDSVFCTTNIHWPVDAGNHKNHPADYLWDDSTTSYNNTLSSLGLHWCRVTTKCSSITDSIHISYHNPDAPHLGPDITGCYGHNTILNANCSNVSSYLWSTSANTPTISVDTTGDYWVQVINTNGCNGSDTVHVLTLVPSMEPVCYVAFDTLTQKNDIHCPTNVGAAVDSFYFYKEISLNVWSKIGACDASTAHFIDYSSAPQAQSYSYEIATVDTCRNESAKSSPHTTITLLSAYDIGTDTYGFTWSAYGGLNPSDYNIYAIDGNGSVSQVGTVPGNQYFYNYLHPNLAFIKYFVGFFSPDCSAKTNVLVKSNWVQSIVTGIQEQTHTTSISILLTPQNTIIISGAMNFEVSIYNILGQNFLTEKNTRQIDIQGLPAGVYLINVTSDGRQITKKIVKL